MAYTPANQNYLPYDWNGVVTANDIAIQNRPFSLGQHLGPTAEQAAQKELEDWFRARGLDPNQYYEAAGVAMPPQPGYNPAGGLINTGKPLKGDMTSSIAADAQAKINKQFEKENEIRFNRKDAAAAGAARQLAARIAAAPTTIAPTTVAPPQDSAAQKTFLPPYLQPGAPTDANNITGAKLPVAAQIASPTPIAPPVAPFTPLMPQGFATPRPVTPGLAPAMAGMPQTNFGGINTGRGFGATAKLLELPWYLRQLTGKAY